jgi:signal transduction histidine kinase
VGCAGCDKPVLVRGNGPAIADAVRNLIENAVTYAPVGDEVKVTVDTEGKLSVSDHGPGIPVLDREHAFERFWRGKSSGGEGAGLGLAITREIMRIHEFTVARCASTTMSVAAPSLPSIFKSGPATWKNTRTCRRLSFHHRAVRSSLLSQPA